MFKQKVIIKEVFRMKNAYQKYIDTISYSEDLEWLKNDIKFYCQLKKPEVREMYKNHIEWEVSQLKKLKDKIKTL